MSLLAAIASSRRRSTGGPPPGPSFVSWSRKSFNTSDQAAPAGAVPGDIMVSFMFHYYNYEAANAASNGWTLLGSIQNFNSGADGYWNTVHYRVFQAGDEAGLGGVFGHYGSGMTSAYRGVTSVGDFKPWEVVTAAFAYVEHTFYLPTEPSSSIIAGCSGGAWPYAPVTFSAGITRHTDGYSPGGEIWDKPGPCAGEAYGVTMAPYDGKIYSSSVALI